jgi:UDP-N-acetyl-D-mannosaminuronate dehydrogenase
MGQIMNIGFIGLGKLGLDAAEVFAEHHTVRGYDVAPRTSTTVQVCDIQETIQQSEWIFIAVPTPHAEGYDGSVPSSHMEPKDFGHDAVVDAIVKINHYATTSKKVVLISTVLPGTTRKYFVSKLSNQHEFLYNPYLIAMGSVKWDMVNPEMIMIGTEDGHEDGLASELIALYHTHDEKQSTYCGWYLGRMRSYQNILQHIYFSQGWHGKHDTGLCHEDRQYQCRCGYQCLGCQYHAYHGALNT